MLRGYSRFLIGESSNAVHLAREERESTILPTQSDGEGRNESLTKDAFLCHSGKQKSVVRRLYQDLIKQGVSCFFDEDPQSLPVGKKFPNQIFEAAEKCRVAVVVLSKEFIHSKWPMQELCAFLRAKNSGKSPHMSILPLFFMLSPKSLSEIAEDNQGWIDLGISHEMRTEWHRALREIRSIKGLVFREVEDVVGFRDEVVKAICSLLLTQSPSSMQAYARQHQVVYGLASILTTLSSTSSFSNYCMDGVLESTSAKTMITASSTSSFSNNVWIALRTVSWINVGNDNNFNLASIDMLLNSDSLLKSASTKEMGLSNMVWLETFLPQKEISFIGDKDR